MTFQPEVPLEEVERRIQAGELSRWETYRLMHQHPLNKLTHVFGIPLVLASVAWPAWVWFAHGRFDWQAMLALGAVGWTLQLLGHRIEGNRPAFFRDLNQMVIGPLFLLSLPLQLLRRRAPHQRGGP